jgi:hypothetical protein
MAARRHAAWAVLVTFISLGSSLAPSPAAAQSTLATVSGTITDQSGGALPGATVTLTNSATGAERTAVTGGAGEFNLPNVDAGNYVMVIRLQGFADVGILVGPDTSVFSMTLGKSFATGGVTKLRFEMAFSNLFNIENLATPNMNITSSSFGRITDTQKVDQAGPRTVQFSLRYTW